MAKTLSMGTDNLDIFIPIPLKIDQTRLETSIRNLIQLHLKAGFSNFILTAPSKGWRSLGYPPPDHFSEIASAIVTFKDRVKDYDIKLGWWNTLVLKTGPASYQRIINLNGEICETSTCPLDPQFQHRFSEDVALVAREAEPELIIFEDDFGINCHNGTACFCDLHLLHFSRQTGRYYTRDELAQIFQEKSAAATALRLQWAGTIRDSLAGLAGRVRQAVDRETPWLPLGSMQPGCADRDGDSTQAVARALAGNRHRPFIRLAGTSYSSDDPFLLPRNLFHALYGKQHLPGDFICYHESDTYPHNRFFMSAGKMRSLMGAVYSYGFAGSTFQACQNLDQPNEEIGYHEMFMQERSRFQAVRQLAQTCELTGCGLLFDPLSGFRQPGFGEPKINHWVSAFAHFGIPYTTIESTVNAISGKMVNSFNDQQIRRLLSKGLILDGEAAEALALRGFEAAIGVRVTGKESILDPGRDLGSSEWIREKFVRSPQQGRQMTWYSTFSPYGNGQLFKLEPTSPKTEIVTEGMDFNDKSIGIGMTRLCNQEGGRVVVMAMSLENNLSSSLFNYRRARLLQDLVVWAGGAELIHVRERPKTFCILNLPKPTTMGSLVGFATLINLCSDRFENLELYLPPAWRENTEIAFLELDGSWKKVAANFTGETVRIKYPMPLYQPSFLRFDRKNQ